MYVLYVLLRSCFLSFSVYIYKKRRLVADLRYSLTSDSIKIQVMNFILICASVFKCVSETNLNLNPWTHAPLLNLDRQMQIWKKQVSKVTSTACLRRVIWRSCFARSFCRKTKDSSAQSLQDVMQLISESRERREVASYLIKLQSLTNNSGVLLSLYWSTVCVALQEPNLFSSFSQSLTEHFLVTET